MTELLELMQSGKWEEAGILAEDLKQAGEASAEFMILYATICAEQGSVQSEYEAICRGLQKYPMNDELYFMLGNYYMGQQRSNLAYLCYEQANHYCKKSDDRQMIKESIGMAAGQPDFEVNAVSVVILAEQNVGMLRDAVESIIEQGEGLSYEIIVVDNECLGQALEWLHKYEQVRLVTCSGKTGFAEGVNIGIKLAQIYNDIYLMSSDAVLLPNTLFWLRMGLYEQETIGAVGGISNKGYSKQRLELPCKTIEEYRMAAEILNVPDQYAHENRLWLDTFSLLLKRTALDDAGLFEGQDIRHWYSCIDYGMKLVKANYGSVLCYNSFIYRHDGIERYGELTFQKRDLDELERKWKFPVLYYCDIRSELIQKIRHSQDEEIYILEVGCGCGSTLSAIQCQYPNAHVYGIELMEEVAASGKYMADIVAGDIETMKLPFERHMFDYIMFGDVLEHLRCPEKVLERMREYLSADGRILTSIPNLMNIGVVTSLLKGNFTYQDKGILDSTHIHMFTLNEIKRMFRKAGYVIKDIQRNCKREEMPDYQEEDQKIIEAVYEIKGIEDIQEFEVYQYLVEAAASENVN